MKNLLKMRFVLIDNSTPVGQNFIFATRERHEVKEEFWDMQCAEFRPIGDEMHNGHPRYEIVRIK